MSLSLLLRLPIRQIRARPASALVTVAGVAVGVAGYRAMDLGVHGALAAMRETYAEGAGPASWVVVPAGDARAALPSRTLDRVEGVPGVASALPLVTRASARLEELHLWMGIVLPEGDAGLTVIGVDPAREAGLGRWTLTSGDAVPATTTVLVGDAWAQARALDLGDPVRILAGGKGVEWRIGGRLARRGLGGRGYGRVVLAPIDTVRDAFGLPPDEVDEIAVVLRPEADAEAVGRALTTAAGPGATVVHPPDRGADVEQKLANMRAGTDLLSSVTLLLAAFLVAGQFSARAAERARQHGLLRAVGATRAQAAAVLVIEGLVLAAAGALGGVALGRPLADGVAFALGQAAQADLHVDTGDTAGAARSALFGLGVAFVAVTIPAVRASRRGPLDAVRARGHAADPAPAWMAAVAMLVLAAAVFSLGFDPASRAPREWTLARVLVGLSAAAALLPAVVPGIVRIVRARLAMSPAAALGVASLRWRPIRSGLAAGAVLLCVAVVGGVGALGGGVRAEMTEWSGHALGWDWYVSRPDGFGDAEVADIARLPGVGDVAGVSVRPVRVEIAGHPASLSLVALDPASYARADLLTFAPPSPEDPSRIVASLADDRGALVTAIVAEQLGVHVGDTLTIPGRDGPVDVTVRGVVIDYTQNGFAVLTSQSLLRRTQGVDRVDLVAIRGPEAGPALAAIPGTVVESRAALRGRILRLVDRSIAALDVLLWLSGVVGVLAVGAAVAQGAVERRADVAVLRAVGLERAGVRRMLVAEALATATIGVLGGFPLGLLLGRVFADASSTLGMRVPWVPPWGALAGASVAALIASVVAAWLPARRAMAIPPMEALRE